MMESGDVVWIKAEVETLLGPAVEPFVADRVLVSASGIRMIFRIDDVSSMDLLNQAADLIEAFAQSFTVGGTEPFDRLLHVSEASPPEALVAALRTAAAKGGG